MSATEILEELRRMPEPERRALVETIDLNSAISTTNSRRNKRPNSIGARKNFVKTRATESRLNKSAEKPANALAGNEAGAAQIARRRGLPSSLEMV